MKSHTNFTSNIRNLLWWRGGGNRLAQVDDLREGRAPCAFHTTLYYRSFFEPWRRKYEIFIRQHRPDHCTTPLFSLLATGRRRRHPVTYKNVDASTFDRASSTLRKRDNQNTKKKTTDAQSETYIVFFDGQRRILVSFPSCCPCSRPSVIVTIHSRGRHRTRDGDSSSLPDRAHSFPPPYLPHSLTNPPTLEERVPLL